MTAFTMSNPYPRRKTPRTTLSWWTAFQIANWGLHSIDPCNMSKTDRKILGIPNPFEGLTNE